MPQDFDAALMATSGRPAPFWLVVENFADMTAAFSRAEAVAAIECLCARVVTLTGCFVDKVDIQEGGARISVNRAGVASDLSCCDVLMAVGQEVWTCRDEGVVLALGAGPAVVEMKPRVPVFVGSAGRDCWLADMRTAVAVHDAIRERRLDLRYQAVATSPGREHVLYYEGLARIAGRSGRDAELSPGRFLPALERLRLTRLFDLVVVRCTLELLRGEPETCLGCNVSALSAVNDLWWQDIQQILRLEPHLARRLIIEITETSPLASLAEAVAFVGEFRRLGTRLAIDDFGSGFSSLQSIIEIRPDIIKIDAAFVAKSLDETSGPALLAGVHRVSACLAEHVVIEGISDAERLRHALDSGASWFQGYHIQEPTLLRSHIKSDT